MTSQHRGVRSDGRSRTQPRRLEEGQHSAGWGQPSEITVNQKRVKVLYWAVRPYGHARPMRHRTQVALGTPDKVLRTRATEQAEAALRSAGHRKAPTRGTQFQKYVVDVVEPAVTSSDRLAAGSIRQYQRALRLLLGRCDEQHRHHHALAPLTLQAATEFRRVVDCLQEIARLHGEEAAHQSRTVLSGYVYQQMSYDNLLDVDPILKRRIDLSSMARTKIEGRKGKVALSKAEYDKVATWLLAYEPADSSEVRSAPPGRRRAVVARLERTRDLTLVQMATGLRIDEALQLPAAAVTITKSGAVVLRVHGKGGYTRIASSWCDRALPVFKRLIADAAPEGPLIGQPADRTKKWDHRNATGSVAELYLMMHKTLGIEAFLHERSHVWRATLNTLLVDVLSAEKRSGQFGHSTKVNEKSYTVLALTESEIGMARQALR